MPLHLPIGSMDRNEILRFHQRHDERQFFFARVTADVYGRLRAVRVINDSFAPIKVIHHASDSALVSWNLAG